MTAVSRMNPTEETRMTRPPAPALPLLDELEELRAKATPGPWHVMRSADEDRAYALSLDRLVTDSAGCSLADAALIVAAVNRLPELTAALRAVLQLADQMDAEAEVREVRAQTYPPSGPWAIEHNRLVVRADTYRRAANRIRAAITTALEAL